MSITRDGRTLGHNCLVDIDVPIGAIMAQSKGKGCVEGDAAIIRITPVTGQYFGRVIKIVDLRPESYKTAMAIMKMNLAEKYAGEYMDANKFSAAKKGGQAAWNKVFNQPATISLGTEVDDRSQRKYPVIYLDLPKTGNTDGYLAVTMMTTGTGIGAYSYRADYPGSYMRKAAVKGSGDTMYFAMVTFTRDDAPIMIIERQFDDEEMVMTDHTMKLSRSILQRVCKVTAEKWLAGEPDASFELEDEDTPEEHPLTEYAGKLGFSNVEATSVIEAGFDTLEKLCRVKTDNGTAGEVGITKVKLSKAVKMAKAIVAGNEN